MASHASRLELITRSGSLVDTPLGLPVPIDGDEANAFADGFAMPTERFFGISDAHLRDDVYDVAGIASLFGAPPRRCLSRGRRLGLFAAARSVAEA